MTLRALLKQNELRVVEVAAGADGLARTISGAVMFDNPEMVNWMRAGEIMLTTGYFLLDDPVKQEKVLRDLADSGSGGLVIKMKRYFHEIPPAMLQLADELHFPLMRIPYHTSLSEISEAVSKYVYGINEEHNTQLLYTLETYFNNCQNSVKTSKALFIHRNTLLYRLDRIAEILDLNYNDSEQMLTFQLALKAFLMCQ